MLSFRAETNNVEDVFFALSVIGDGTNTNITVDLKKSPFRFKFKGNLPVGFDSVSVGGVGGTVTLNSDKTKIDIALSSAPANGALAPLSGYLTYDS